MSNLSAVLSPLSGLPPFAAYLAIGLIWLIAFFGIYLLLTPHKELDLIRKNNIATALALAGAILGFTLPLSSAIKNSVGLIDCAIWGGIALLVQAAVFVVVRLLLIRDLPNRLAAGEIAPATLVAVLSISVGLLNAASMTY